MAVQSPPFVQQSASHSAALFRQALGSIYWQGGPTDGATLVVAAQSTPNMSVQVSAGQAWIDGTQVANASGQIFSTQGTYYALNDAAVTLTIAAAHPTLPRIDVVCFSVTDAQYSGTNGVALSVVTGTPASSPTVPSAPNNAIVLAQVAVAGAATSITNANITNRTTPAVVNGTPVPVTSTSRPTGTRLGALAYETDTAKLILNGTTGWAPYGSGTWATTSASRPASPSTGQTFWESDTKRLMLWDGSQWVCMTALHGRVSASGGTIGNNSSATYSLGALPSTVGPGQFIKGWISATVAFAVSGTTDQTLVVTGVPTVGITSGLFDGWTMRLPAVSNSNFPVLKYQFAFQAVVTASAPTVSVTFATGNLGVALIVNDVRFDYSTGVAA